MPFTSGVLSLNWVIGASWNKWESLPINRPFSVWIHAGTRWKLHNFMTSRYHVNRESHIKWTDLLKLLSTVGHLTPNHRRICLSRAKKKEISALSTTSSTLATGNDSRRARNQTKGDRRTTTTTPRARNKYTNPGRPKLIMEMEKSKRDGRRGLSTCRASFKLSPSQWN